MKRRGIASEQRSQFVVENFYDLLPGRNAANNCFTQRFLLDAGNKFSGDLKIDIRFEQRQAHLTKSSIDVRLADNAMSPELFENLLKLVAKLWKHDLITRSRGRDRQHARRVRSPELFFCCWRRRCSPSGRAFFNPEGPMRLDFLACGFHTDKYTARFLAQF